MAKMWAVSWPVLRKLLGPAAGAVGMWLATDFPAVHSALCLRGVL